MKTSTTPKTLRNGLSHDRGTNCTVPGAHISNSCLRSGESLKSIVRTVFIIGTSLLPSLLTDRNPDTTLQLQASLLQLAKPERSAVKTLRYFLDDRNAEMVQSERGFLDKNTHDLVALATEKKEPLAGFIVKYFYRLLETRVSCSINLLSLRYLTDVLRCGRKIAPDVSANSNLSRPLESRASSAFSPFCYPPSCRFCP
jgi:hypothetical protein